MFFFTIVLKNLWRRPVRSVLTLVGVAVAVGTTIALLSVSEGLREQTLESLEGRGIDLVILEQGVVDQLNSELDEGLVPLLAALPEVREVGPTLTDLGAFPTPDDNTLNAVIQGWVPEGCLFAGLRIQRGRNLRVDDERSVVLGYVLAERLRKDVGATLEVDGEPFEVVGVFESYVPAENSGLIMPLAQLQRVMVHPGRLTGIGVILHESARSSETIEALRAKIEQLRLPNGRAARAVAMPTRDYVADAGHLRIANAMAWITSAIAVAVGTIGVLNTMLMSVTERQREISVLRAMGWRKSRVLRMILGESLLLTLVGSLFGAIAGYLLASSLTYMPIVRGLLESRTSPRVLFFGAVMALLVGLLGGVLPAIRGARTLPAEGLRHE